MSIDLNHTIVHARDREASAGFLEINQRFGGRGVYFADPDGHNMELLTKA